MSPLAAIVQRNIGNVLTPELAFGIVESYEQSLPGVVHVGLPARLAGEPCGHDPRLVYDDPTRVAQWVAQQIGRAGPWGAMGALGLLALDRDDLVAGIVVHEITATNAFGHLAVVGKRSLTRGFVQAGFDYVFRQLDLERLTCLVDWDNADSLRLCAHLGFEQEHIIKNGNAGQVVMLSLFREQCRWLRG